jgi:uncharacterized protein (TIGR02266 family)
MPQMFDPQRKIEMMLNVRVAAALEGRSLSGTENRRHVRVDTRLRCWCEGQNVTVYARIGNLSEGGLFVRTSMPLERGVVTVLRFGRNRVDEVEARAVVIWSRGEGHQGPPGMGLRFEEQDPAKLELIRRLVQEEKRAKVPENG